MGKKTNEERIEIIVESLMKVARGDYSAQIELSENNDNLDSLAMGFNMMVDDINTNYELRKQNERIQAINETLNKALSKAEESDRLKSAFLANISHEIRTPLNAILGFSELINKDLTDDTFKEYSYFIINAGNQLLRIIEDILDISKLESNQIQIHKEECEINTLLHEVYNFCSRSERLIQNPAINLKLSIPDISQEVIVTTDSVRLKQIINNLINNAIKFTEQGVIQFGYSIQDDKSDKKVLFYVKDNGIGIPHEKLDIIFDRFVQIEGIQYNHGNGIGLSICKGLVELLGGNIWAESEIGKGASFYFTIPMQS